MNTIRKITHKSLIMNRSRTLMTIIAIILSCGLITVVAGIATSFAYSLTVAEINNSGDYDVSLQGSFNDKNVEDISKNRDVDGAYYKIDTGIAKIPEPKSVYTPYVVVTALSRSAIDECFSAKLSEGRFPEKDTEIVLSPAFIKYSKATYKPGDKISLALGDRYSSPDGTKENGTMLLSFEPVSEGKEYLDSSKTVEYTVVGILSSISREAAVMEMSPCVNVYTLASGIDNTWTTEGFSGGVGNIYVDYINSVEKDYLKATAQLVGISEDQARRYLDNNYASTASKSDSTEKTERDIVAEAIEKGNSFGITGFEENKTVLEVKGIIRQDSRSNSLYAIAAMLITIVVVTSVFIISNSISISVTEKTKLYGMLSTIGATPRQIRNSVIYEGMILAAFGIPIGVLLGVGASFGLVSFSNGILNCSLNTGDLVFNIPVWAIAVAAVLALVTVFLSSLRIAVTAAKISPIEAVRLVGNVKLKNKNKENNYKVPKFVRSLFGEGGCIAWKNMKRSRRQYRTTVVSLALSAMIFLSVSTFVEAMMKELSSEMFFANYDMAMSGDPKNAWNDPSLEEGQERANITREYRSFFEKIASNSNVDSYSFNILTTVYRFSIPDSALSSSKGEGTANITKMGGSEIHQQNLVIVAVDPQSYDNIIKSTGKTAKELRGKGVIFNSNYWFNYTDDGKEEISHTRLFDNPVGMKLSGSIDETLFADYDGDREKISIEIGAEIDDDSEIVDIVGVDAYRNTGAIIMQLDDFENTVENWFTVGDMFVMTSNAVQLEADISDMPFGQTITVNNIKEVRDADYSVVLVIQIFVYGFIGAMTLISLTNIFNTVTTNMKLRQRELAMLRSIGMTNKEFNGMIILESLFCSAKALIIGMPLGLIAGWLVCKMMDSISLNSQIDSCYVFPLVQTIICIIAITLIVGIIMYYSVSRIRKQNIIETIRNENI